MPSIDTKVSVETFARLNDETIRFMQLSTNAGRTSVRLWTLPDVPVEDESRRIALDRDGNVLVDGLDLLFSLKHMLVFGCFRLSGDAVPSYGVFRVCEYRQGLANSPDFYYGNPTEALRECFKRANLESKESLNGQQRFSLKTETLQAVIQQRYYDALMRTNLINHVKKTAIKDLKCKNVRAVEQELVELLKDRSTVINDSWSHYPRDHKRLRGTCDDDGFPGDYVNDY